MAFRLFCVLALLYFPYKHIISKFVYNVKLFPRTHIHIEIIIEKTPPALTPEALVL